MMIKRKKNNTFSAVIISEGNRNEVFAGNFNSLIKTMNQLNHQWYVEEK